MPIGQLTLGILPSISFSTAIQASKKWQYPTSLQTYLPLSCCLFSGCCPLRLSTGRGVVFPTGQASCLQPAKAMFPARALEWGMMHGQTFSGLSSARMEERGEGKGRGRGVGDKAGCGRPTSCFFVLCHRDKILFILFCFQFIKRAHFTHTQIKVFP